MIKPGSEPIPGYLVEERLGAGQFGEVWRARSPGNTYVALKVLQLSGKHGWKEFRAVQRVKQIRHANLMPIIAIWLLDDDDKVISDDVIESIARSADESNGEAPIEATIFAEPVSQSRRPAQMIIANLLANQSLGDRLKDTQKAGMPGIPVDELLGYMDDAAKGLDFLNTSSHRIGDSRGAVQHCDVKPDNIMLTGGSAVVTDFGVAQMAEVGSGATATSMGGTPAYMAPECFESRTSNSTDQYALAITYYQLRTGLLPFEKETYAAVYETHKSGTHDFSAVPPREQAVLRKATSPQPERRYKSCVQFVDELHDAVGPVKPEPSKKRFIAAAACALLGVVGLAMAISSGTSSESNNLANAVDMLNQGQYEAAVTLAEKLPDADQINDVLLAIREKLGGTADADAAFVAANIRLIGFLQGSAFESQLDEAAFNDVRTRVATDLDQLIDPIRAACDQWNPKDEQEAPPGDLQARIEKLSQLLCTESAGGLPIDECVARQPALELQRIRMEAREDRSKWPELSSQLESIDVANLSSTDASHRAALAFIFGVKKNDPLTLARIKERLSDYLPAEDAFDSKQLAVWEFDQVDRQMQEIDDAIDVEWLAHDTPFSELVKGIIALDRSSKAAQDQVALAVATAQKHRKQKQFAKAAELLTRALPLAELSSAPSAQSTRQRILDELFIIDLVDPATPPSVIYNRLAGSKTPDYPAWKRVADQIHDEYGLASFGALDPSKIAVDRAALVESLKLECESSDPKASVASDAGMDPFFEALQRTPFLDYAQYVQSVIHWRAANQEPSDIDRKSQRFSQASAAVRAAFAGQGAPSLLTAPYRRQQAYAILVNAVETWSGRKAATDADFGAGSLFGERGPEAYANLLLARELSSPHLSRDALLLAAAVDEWSDAQGRDAAHLLEISKYLVAQGQTNETVKSLFGTIHCAAFKAGLATGAPDVELVQSAASSLAELYLKQRPESEASQRELSPERLRKIAAELLTPALPIAERAWTTLPHASMQDPGAPDLASLYRSAGFLYGEEAVASDVRDFELKNPEDLVFDYLGRANGLEADAASLIAQGHALEHISTLPASWRADLNTIADRAVESAMGEQTPVVRGRAFAFKAYARSHRARDPQRSTADRNADRAEALELVDQALAEFGDGSGKLATDFADSLITRAAINIEYVYFGNLSFAERKEHLRLACQDAEAASQIEGRKHPEFAYNAWGNALEDLAYYLFDNPSANYKLACDKFEEAIRVSKPAEAMLSLSFANHLPAHRNLVRCRLRWATSGACPLESDDRALLNQAIGAVRKDFEYLMTDDAAPGGVDAKRAGEVAELLYWFSNAHKELARRTSDANSLKNSDDALNRAVQWALFSQMWEDWAKYQSVAAKARLDAAQVIAAQLDAARNDPARQDAVEQLIRQLDAEMKPAVEISRQILSAEQDHGAKLSYDYLFTASQLFLTALELQQTVATDDQWNAILNRFPEGDPLAAEFLLQLKIRRMRAQNDFTDDVIKSVDALLTSLEATAAKRSDVALLRLDWVASQVGSVELLVIAANSKGNKPLALSLYSDYAARLSAALAAVDGSLPDVVNGKLDLLKSDSRLWRDPKKLSRWEKVELGRHFASTFYARRLIAHVAGILVKAQALNTPPNILAMAREALLLSPPEIVQEFLTTAELADWKLQRDSTMKDLAAATP